MSKVISINGNDESAWEEDCQSLFSMADKLRRIRNRYHSNSEVHKLLLDAQEKILAAHDLM
jgi:hypothetical protein